MGLALGPLLGLNLAGMLLSRPNWQGGSIGLAVGFAAALWLGVGSAICPPTTVTAVDCPVALRIGRITFFWFGCVDAPVYSVGAGGRGCSLTRSLALQWLLAAIAS